jgi:protein disulfide-isomerase
MADHFAGGAASIPAVEPPRTEPQQANFEIPTENWNAPAPGSLESQPGFTPAADQPRNGQPAAVDGFCPVTLVERENWIQGDPRWGAVHEGQTYLFAGLEEQQRFLQNPERYAPALAGNDPVVALDEQRTVPGEMDFSAVFDGHLYLFSSRASLARFRVNPQRYANVQEVP